MTDSPTSFLLPFLSSKSGVVAGLYFDLCIYYYYYFVIFIFIFLYKLFIFAYFKVPNTMLLLCSRVTAEPYYFLNLMSVVTREYPFPAAEGVKAALYTAKSNGIEVELVEPSDPNASVESIINETLKNTPGLLGMIGPLSDELLEAVCKYTEEKDPTLTAFSPYTYFTETRMWSMQKYFMRASPVAEIYAIVTNLLQVGKFRRIGIMHLTGSAFSESGYKTLKSALYTAHQVIPIEYIEQASSPNVNLVAFDEFMAQSPQAIIMYAVEGHHTLQFVQLCTGNPHLSQIPLLFTSGGYTAMYKSMMQSFDYNFYFTSTNLLPTDTQFQQVQAFEKEMKAYIASGTSIIPAYEIFTSPAIGGLVMYGWLTGKLLLESIRRGDTSSRAAFQESLFAQKLYLIENEALFGIFGSVCSEYEQMEKASCECNQGGHTVHVYNIRKKHLEGVMGLTATLESTFTYSRDTCYATDYILPFYAESLIIDYQNPMLLTASKKLVEGVKLAVRLNVPTEVVVGYNVINSSSDNTELYNCYKDYLIDIIMGPLMNPREAAETLTSLIVDPMNRFPVPRIASPQVLYLMPTLDQQIYIAAELAARLYLRMTVFLRETSETEAITGIIHEAAQVAGVGGDIIPTPFKDARDLPNTNFMVIIGTEDGISKRIYHALKTHPKRYILILFEEMAVLYEELLETFADVPVEITSRLLVCTNLPLWTTESDAFETETRSANSARKFSKLLLSPIHLQAWYAVGVLGKVLTGKYGNVTISLADSVYRYSNYDYDGINFGRFQWGADCSASNLNCRNYGASNINVISLAKAFDYTLPASFGPFNPSMELPEKRLINMNVAIACGTVMFVVFFTLLGMFIYLCCRRRSRNNTAAPKDNCKPVTLMFTDIQSSTALWASFPEQMTEAMNVHHRLIREQILLHNCYEVKTIGDSFMIASHNHGSMIKLAIGIQETLFTHDWESDCFDQFYVQAEKVEESKEWSRQESELPEGAIPPETEAASLMSKNYYSSWHGLRVRIGIHTGMCEIRFDEVTKGFDYYGDTVNIAARTEAMAMGGQILMTKSTWDAVCAGSDADFCQTASVADLGAHRLRGVTLPVEMYQVDSIPNRVFKEIVSGNEGSDEDEDEKRSDSHAPKFNNGFAETVYKVFKGAYSALTQKQRLVQLKPLMASWKVSTECSGLPEERRYEHLLLRFSNRISKVIACREFTVNASDFSAERSSRNQNNSARPSQTSASHLPSVTAVASMDIRPKTIQSIANKNNSLKVQRDFNILRAANSASAGPFLLPVPFAPPSPPPMGMAGVSKPSLCGTEVPPRAASNPAANPLELAHNSSARQETPPPKHPDRNQMTNVRPLSGGPRPHSRPSIQGGGRASLIHKAPVPMSHEEEEEYSPLTIGLAAAARRPTATASDSFPTPPSDLGPRPTWALTAMRRASRKWTRTQKEGSCYRYHSSDGVEREGNRTQPERQKTKKGEKVQTYIHYNRRANKRGTKVREREREREKGRGRTDINSIIRIYILLLFVLIVSQKKALNGRKKDDFFLLRGLANNSEPVQLFLHSVYMIDSLGIAFLFILFVYLCPLRGTLKYLTFSQPPIVRLLLLEALICACGFLPSVPTPNELWKQVDNGIHQTSRITSASHIDVYVYVFKPTFHSCVGNMFRRKGETHMNQLFSKVETLILFKEEPTEKTN
eukprot:gene7392-5205_t